MKKLLAVILVLALIGLVFVCSKFFEKEPDLTQMLLADWSDYLLACENIYEDIQWTFSYAENFVQKPTWENLQLARVAVSTAEQDIISQLPEEKMNFEDYDVFIQKGMDVSFVPVEIGSYTLYQNDILTVCRAIQRALSISTFYKNELVYLSKDLEILQQIYDNDLRGMALSTNYLLLTLGDNKQTKDFYTLAAEQYPLIAAFQAEYANYNEDQMVEEATSVLNNTEDLKTEVTELEGVKQAYFDIYQDDIAAGNKDVFKNGILEIQDLPLVLPYPDWYQEEQTEYQFFWNNEDGTKVYPKVKESLSKIPDGCVLKWSGISKEDLLNYHNSLTNLGIKELEFEANESSCEIYYEFADSTFVLSWQNDIAQISMLKNPLCLAPTWYAEMLLKESVN